MTKAKTLPSYWRVLAGAALAVAAASLFVGLNPFPAVTLDESWIGLFAMRLSAQGFCTPHQMNTYTGPLYGLLLSRVFAWLGVGIWQLRLPGAAANVLAWLIAAVVLRRRLGAEAAAWWCALIASSAFALLKSRLAWEVYALQPLLLSLTLFLLDGQQNFLRATALATLTLIGVQNHFIYLSVPASLTATYAFAVAWRERNAAAEKFRLWAAILAAGAIVYLVKPRLTDADWARDRLWAVPLFILLAPAAAWLSMASDWDRPILTALARPSVRRWSGRAATAGALAFVFWHGGPLIQSAAGPVVWARVFSWRAPWWLVLLTTVWGAVIVAAAAWRAVRAVLDRNVPFGWEWATAAWPAMYAACFIAFRHTSSLRYYAIAHFLTLYSAAVGLSRLARPDKKWAIGLAAAALIAVQGVFWSELAAPGDRRPLRLKIGWRTENSWDFARKDALFAAFDASRACGAAPINDFLQVPLAFHRAASGRDCDAGKIFVADYCRTCTTPPFQRWTAAGR